MGTLGISVRRAELHGVLVRGGRVVWSARAAVGPGDSPADGIDRLLATLRMRRWRLPRVVVALSGALCHVKELAGLPAIHNPGMLTRIVRENSASFFLGIGARLVVSDVLPRADGAPWAAAFDGDLVDRALVMLRRRRLRRVTIVPALAARAKLLGEGTHSIDCDGAWAEITIGVRGDIRRLRRAAFVHRSVVAPAALADLGAAYLDAYAATRTSRAMDLAWRPAPGARHARLAARVRLAAAGLVFIAAAAGAVLAPGIRAAQVAMRADLELSAARAAGFEATRVEAELALVSGHLDRIDRFRGGRGRLTLLLASIARVLPESTAIVTLRLDSLEGSFVALTPRAAGILPRLSTVQGMAGARIVGAVTRESRGGARLERATIRFVLPRDAASAVFGAGPKRGPE